MHPIWFTEKTLCIETFFIIKYPTSFQKFIRNVEKTKLQKMDRVVFFKKKCAAYKCFILNRPKNHTEKETFL